jgi:translation initiation factor 1 (eIF-1/SUI1)
MNPFNNFSNSLLHSNNNITLNDNLIPKSIEFKIEIWVEIMGRKKNTYISGWNIPEASLKEHVKYIKKKNGCNGTIKKIIIDNIEKTVMLLQGDHIDFITEYLYSQGIERDSIYLKGQ